MGELPIHYNSTMRVILLLIVAAAFVSAEQSAHEESAPSMEAPEADLLAVVKELRGYTDGTALASHGMRIEDHANLIQKARAYKHSFGARNALRAAIRALVSELTSGHNHDRNALNNERNAGHNAIRNASNRGKGVTRRYREKACPTKKAQVEAEAARNAAKGALNSIKRKKICNLGTTWFSMNIKGNAPKFGAELRNAWDKQRAEFVRKLSKYNAAVKAYNKAAREHAASMSAFKSTVRVEAANTKTSCHNAHRAYNLLARDVASNVSTRKQGYIASKVITCYVNNLTSNGSAKSCADRARRANTSRWNITPAKMNACLGKAALEAQLGPLTWRPRNSKERTSKERTNKERTNKERAAKEKTNKERNAKNHAKAQRVGVKGHWWHSWINGWDGNMHWATPNHVFWSGLRSVHNNGREDRLYSPLLTRNGANIVARHWSGWLNNWDQYFAYSCPNNYVVSGMISYHHNGAEDRRFRIQCAHFQHLNVRKHGWPGWQTPWDGTFHIGCGHNPAVGFSSYHDNRKEDRRWRVQCGNFVHRL